MPGLWLFMTVTALGGLGGLVGSIVGGAIDDQALFVGGYLGGVLIAPLSARVALWRRWIAPTQYWHITIGAALGFAAAATLAISTLSSPLGPAVSALLTGAGALVGRRLSQ